MNNRSLIYEKDYESFCLNSLFTPGFLELFTFLNLQFNWFEIIQLLVSHFDMAQYLKCLFLYLTFLFKYKNNKQSIHKQF